jgi:hypothetical protein
LLEKQNNLHKSDNNTKMVIVFEYEESN